MCDVLLIEETEDTPRVLLDKDRHIFEFSGRSMPEDAAKFFSPIQQWIKKYIENPNPVSVFRFYFEYFNTSSARKLVELMLDIENLAKSGKEVCIIWQHSRDDELIEAKGREISSIVNLPFEIQAI